MFVSPWKRRILVNGFQYRLLIGNFLYLASVVVAFVIVLFAPVMMMLADETMPAAQREVAAHQMLVMHERIWFALPVLIALCILHAAVVSHRIAGPLHRFKLIFSKLAAGDMDTDVTVRRHDYLRQEAEIMGEMVRSISDRVRAIQHGYQDASRTLPQLMEAVGRGNGEEAKVLAGKLGTQMDQLGQRVRQFHVAGGEDTSTADACLEPTRQQTPVG